MSNKRRSFTPEYKEQVARMVVEESRAIPSTAREIGVNEQTLRNWVHEYRKNHAGDEPPLTISERARLGVHCSVELARGLMRELGLVPCQPQPWRHSLTEADPSAGPIPDLLARDF